MSRLPGKTGKAGEVAKGSGSNAIDAFLDKAAQTPTVHDGNRGRLVFALDACLYLQGNYCSFGCDQGVKSKKQVREIIDEQMDDVPK